MGHIRTSAPRGVNVRLAPASEGPLLAQSSRGATRLIARSGLADVADCVVANFPVGLSLVEASLELANDLAELTGRKQPGSKRARPVLSKGRQRLQSSPDICGHTVKLPVEFILSGLWVAGSREFYCFDSVGGGPKSVRAHMANRRCLTSRPGGGGCSR